MSSLSNIYIKKETLEVLLKTVNAKGEKGLSIDISINDETNQYDQNVTAYVSQTKEQREAKAQRYYIGNGRCFWTDGKITIATKKEQVHQAELLPSVEDESDLPF
jgi:hypothetical protein